MNSLSDSLATSIEALACLTEAEMHDLIAPSLPDNPAIRESFSKMAGLIFPDSRRVSAPPRQVKKGRKAASKAKPTPILIQQDMALGDPCLVHPKHKLKKAKEVLAEMPIVPGVPTQPQMELLARILGDRKEVEAVCCDLGLPNPFMVFKEQVGLTVTMLVAALAPPPRPGCRSKEVNARMSQLRGELRSRKRHRSQVGGKCEPLWRQQSPDTSPPPPDPPTLPLF